MSTLDFDIKLRRKDVTLTGPNGKEEYYIEELTGEDRDIFLDEMKGRMTVGVDGKVSDIKSFVGLHTSLLKRCFHRKDGKLVDIDVINKLPGRVQTALYEAAQNLSSLSIVGADDAKND